MNQTRGLLSEYGLVAAKGHKAFLTLLREAEEPPHSPLTPLLKSQLTSIRQD